MQICAILSHVDHPCHSAPVTRPHVRPVPPSEGPQHRDRSLSVARLFRRAESRYDAKTLAQETEIIRDHRRAHANCADRRNTGGTSPGRAVVNRPPVPQCFDPSFFEHAAEKNRQNRTRKRSNVKNVTHVTLRTPPCHRFSAGPHSKYDVKALAQETEIIRDHRRPTPTSRARAAANRSTNSTTSRLQRLPVSQTHHDEMVLVPFEYFVVRAVFVRWSCHQCCSVRGRCDRGRQPFAVRAHLNVMSTANCAPTFNGSPEMNHSMARSWLDVHVAELGIAPNCRLRSLATSSQRSLSACRCGTQPSRPWACRPMPSVRVHLGAALALVFHHLRWQPKWLQNQGAEELWRHGGFKSCGCSVQHVARTGS